jgi:hypothetical protein
MKGSKPMQSTPLALNLYISRIRNTKKRQYAFAYLEFLLGKTSEPERGELSYMAAQAVRINLHDIMKQSEIH